MGFNLFCKDMTYGSSYIYWNGLRKYIIITFIRHLIEKEKNTKNTENKITDQLLDIVNNKYDILFELFINLYKENSSYFLTEKIYGIYLLVNKTDVQGIYTPHESIHIVTSLILLFQYINDQYINDIDNILNIFKTSIEHDENVIIG